MSDEHRESADYRWARQVSAVLLIAVIVVIVVLDVIEAVPGWTLEVETQDADTDDERITKVRWSGGPLPAGQFADFGMRAYFPDLEGAIEFPTLQRRGLTEIHWVGDGDADNPAPRVAVRRSIGDREEVELAQSVEALRADVASLKEELSGVDPANVRSRVADVEDQIPSLVDRMDRLAERISALEKAEEDRADGSDTQGSGDGS